MPFSVSAVLRVVGVMGDRVAFEPVVGNGGVFGMNSFVQDAETKKFDLEEGDVVEVGVEYVEGEGAGFVRQVYSVFEEGFYTQMPQEGKKWLERVFYQDTGFVALRGVRPRLDGVFEVGDLVRINLRRVER